MESFRTHGVTLSSNRLYGTTTMGGANDSDGMIFGINTDGSGYADMHDFDPNSDGSLPGGGLVIADGTIYGTTLGGRGGSWRTARFTP